MVCLSVCVATMLYQSCRVNHFYTRKKKNKNEMRSETTVVFFAMSHLFRIYFWRVWHKKSIRSHMVWIDHFIGVTWSFGRWKTQRQKPKKKNERKNFHLFCGLTEYTNNTTIWFTFNVRGSERAKPGARSG